MKAHAILDTLPDVGRITVHAGQVLVYPRHTPPGVFVVLSGVLCRFAEGTSHEACCGDRLDGARGAFAVPAPDEMGSPAFAGVAAVSDAELLFVPRSVALASADLARVFADAGIAVVPLADGVKRRGQAVTSRRGR